MKKETVERFFSLLFIITLLAIFITSPFMVECVRADGRRIVEIVGNDPCKDSHDTVHSSHESGIEVKSIADSPESGSACSDRFSESPKYTKQSLYRSVSLKLFLVECEQAPDVEAVFCSHNRIRLKPSIYLSPLSLNLPLLI